MHIPWAVDPRLWRASPALFISSNGHPRDSMQGLQLPCGITASNACFMQARLQPPRKKD
jgi:hypothetical protein